MVAGKEVSPKDQRDAAQLRRYFTRCVTNLSRHLKDPKGYCADLHHEVLGFWPGDKRNKPDKGK